jgi:hypothetical protein
VVAIEPENGQILSINISKESIMFVAVERFIGGMVKSKGKPYSNRWCIYDVLKNILL